MLVIFDCDGVLIDSEIIAARIDSELLTEAGYPVSAEEVGQRFAGLNWNKIVEAVEGELGHSIPEEILDKSEKELDIRLAAEVQAVNGAEAMLDSLDFARCICSNSSSERLEMTLTKTGLFDRFRPYIFAARDVRDGLGKPAPDVFLHAAETLEFEPHRTIVVEDSVVGVQGAVAAGMRVVGFTGASHSWPGHGEALMDAGAVTVVHRLSDLPATFNALAEWNLPEFNV